MRGNCFIPTVGLDWILERNLGCEGGEALHKLPREALADPGSLKLSKARLVGALGTLVQWKACLPMAAGWNYILFKVLPTQTIPQLCNSLNKMPSLNSHQWPDGVRDDGRGCALNFSGLW